VVERAYRKGTATPLPVYTTEELNKMFATATPKPKAKAKTKATPKKAASKPVATKKPTTVAPQPVATVVDSESDSSDGSDAAFNFGLLSLLGLGVVAGVAWSVGQARRG
jgi:hypothetical protein